MRPITARLALLAASFVTLDAGAQTLRFQTSVGDFDMVLNPTADPNLDPLVDNMLAYVGLGRYHYAAINRAASAGDGGDFVLQMGGFLGFPRNPELFASTLTPTESFDPVVVDADGDGSPDFTSLSNQRGTVSLALSSFATGITNPNSGTREFFVNLQDNSFLDPQGFVPFAEIPDLSTIDTILDLMQADTGGSTVVDDLPLMDNGKIVVLERVFLVEAIDDFTFVGPIADALNVEVPAASAAATASFATDGGAVNDASSAAFAPVVGSTPEPASLALLLPAAWPASSRRRRQALTG